MNITYNLESAKEEILIEGLTSGVDYAIEADIIDKDQELPVEAMAVVNFHTQKCTPPGEFFGWLMTNFVNRARTNIRSCNSDTSNIALINTEEETGIELIRDEMHICNFSLRLKTPGGDEKMFWKRKKYAYTLLHQKPDDAESLIVEHESGEPIEYKLSTTSFPTGDY
jgi:hypothetical protein